MNELAIQAEVGRRLRAAIGRAHKGHALKVNSKFAWNSGDVGGKNDDIPALIEQLIASGAFTTADKAGLQALSPDTIRALAEKFSGGEAEEVVDEVRNSCSCHDEDHSEFIHAGRPQALRRELPGVRADRNFRIANAQHNRMVANAKRLRVTPNGPRIAKGMLPPSSRRGS